MKDLIISEKIGDDVDDDECVTINKTAFETRPLFDVMMQKDDKRDFFWFFSVPDLALWTGHWQKFCFLFYPASNATWGNIKKVAFCVCVYFIIWLFKSVGP